MNTRTAHVHNASETEIELHLDVLEAEPTFPQGADRPITSLLIGNILNVFINILSEGMAPLERSMRPCARDSRPHMNTRKLPGENVVVLPCVAGRSGEPKRRQVRQQKNLNNATVRQTPRMPFHRRLDPSHTSVKWAG